MEEAEGESSPVCSKTAVRHSLKILECLEVSEPMTLSCVYPLVKNIFPQKLLRDIRPAGRLRRYLRNWQVLTKDQHVLQCVQGYQIPFMSTSRQFCIPHSPNLTKEEELLVEQEVQVMLVKGAIEVVNTPLQDQYLSTLFLVPKVSGGNRPLINLKSLNSFIPYDHFKMESLALLKELLRKGEFMCKIDLKDAYFSVPLHHNSQRFVRFR